MFMPIPLKKKKIGSLDKLQFVFHNMDNYGKLKTTIKHLVSRKTVDLLRVLIGLIYKSL